ncbi:hypothetical protein [Streptomyces halobius]|uniref:Uncharacterized protein n=1 Tax=Streptomyces halobius TaxID=2879846 RepID=A0ABY4M1N7_9ACTN|nr:hypothetical protein [Streptomyces halobius]UQA91647.1 hypothetical protein K9S39_07030 [Streptomyces halobius]
MINTDGWMVVNEVTGDAPIKGDTVTSFRGEEWRLDAISRLPEGNSMGRVLVSRECPECRGKEHVVSWHRDEREQREFLPSVFDLVITEDH